MLNRHLIRIRAMQTLFAYEKSKGANFLLSLDSIANDFQPNLNSMEKQNKSKLLGYQKLAQSIFTDEVLYGKTSEESQVFEISKSIKKAKELFKLNTKKDFQLISVNSIIDAEKVYDIYLMLLNLLIEIKAKFKNVNNLYNNKVINALENSNELKLLSLKRGTKFENHASFISKLFNEALKSNKHILEYAESTNHTAEDDVAIVKYIIKNIFLKNEVTEEFFEKISLFWIEDKDILRTMLFSSLKDFEKSGEVTIEVLDDTWDENKDFLKILFQKTVEEEAETMNLLIPKLKNWEFDRIIETDKVLLRMAVTELLHFPSIPVKVTINEIIEIAKNYSSEKSGPFINGVLDSVVKDLTKQNLLKKTGRGMLDNKY